MTVATRSAAIAELVGQFRQSCDSAGSVVFKELDLFSRFLFPSNGAIQRDSAVVAFYQSEYSNLLEVLLQYSSTSSPVQILPFFKEGITSDAWAACCGALATNKDGFALRVLKELLNSPSLILDTWSRLRVVYGCDRSAASSSAWDSAIRFWTTTPDRVANAFGPKFDPFFSPKFVFFR